MHEQGVATYGYSNELYINAGSVTVIPFPSKNNLLVSLQIAQREDAELDRVVFALRGGAEDRA